MKKIFVLFLLIAGYATMLACKCSGLGMVGINFQKSDFVGEIEILKIRNSSSKSRTYLADVKVLKLYKGKEINTLEVHGLIGDIQSAACEVQIKQGQKFLMYLSGNDGDTIMSMTTSGNNATTGKYFTVSACTPKSEIKENSRTLALERAALEFLASNPSDLAQAFYLDNSVTANSDGDFKSYIITEPARSFAVYKLKVNGKSEVEEIEALQNFGSSQDGEIMRLIKKNFVIGKDFFSEVRNEEVLLTLFYNPDKNASTWGDTLTQSLVEPIFD